MICLNDDAIKVARNFLNKKYLEENKIDKAFWHFDHVYMNLPVLCIEFLHVFRGLLKMGDKEIWNENNLPLIHVNGFVKGSDDAECKRKMLERIKI